MFSCWLISFLHFRLNENPSTIFKYIDKFIYNSILSVIFLIMIYDIECSTFREKNSFDETFCLPL